VTSRYSQYKALKFARPAPRVLEVILSKPGRLNALDADGHRELAEVWRDIDRDPETSVALLRGEGGAFSAGGDLRMVEAMTRDWATRTRVWKEASDLVYNIVNATKPIVAAIEGPCVGAGLATAMVADITVAGRTARIIDGHTRLGVAAGDHSAIVWPLLCGMAKAKYYLLLCEAVTGEEAERIGPSPWWPTTARWWRRLSPRPRSSAACPPRPCAGPSTRSTTGCGWRGPPSMPPSPWSSWVSPARRPRRASPR
jgi:enoyl-CoA hydratase